MELSPSASWIIRVIESCETSMQMELCDNLIQNYRKMCKDEHIEKITNVFHKKAVQTNYYQHK